MTEKLTPKRLQGKGGGEIPDGLPGNIGRKGIESDSYAVAAHIEPDGSGFFVVHHGGINQKFLFNDAQRRILIAGFGGRDALKPAAGCDYQDPGRLTDKFGPYP